MYMNVMWIYGLFAVCGLFFQAILSGGKRALVYPMSLMLGLIAGVLSNYHLLAFVMGMISRALIGKYWHCAAAQGLCLLSGFLLGFYVI